MFECLKRWGQYRFSTNYPFSENHEKLIRLLIDNHKDVDFISSNDHEFKLKLKNMYFEVWVANYPYAYLNQIRVATLKPNCNYDGERWYACMDDIVVLSDGMPSNKTIVDFYNLYHLARVHVEKSAALFKQTKAVGQILNKFV